MCERYPRLEINLKKIYSNTKVVNELCNSQGIKIAGVVKGFNAIPEVAVKMLEGGCQWIASSRIEQLKDLIEYGIKAPMMLIRIPMFCEIEDVISYSDISLNSEKETIIKLNEECKIQNKQHKVILMYDVGDLREGLFDKEELIKLALFVENELDNIILYGIGTNLSCYGSITPSVKNLTQLGEAAIAIEEKIKRKLDIVSGGSTTSLTLVNKGEVPEKINHLRLGEGMINTQDLPKNWNCNINGLDKDTFILKAQIVELNEKPTYPIGEFGVAAFGNKPHYEDRGIRKRAILAIGNQDLGNSKNIIPKDKKIIVLGASSDHTIIDINDCDVEYKVGDIIEFNILYQPMLFTTQCKSVVKKLIES